MKPVIAILGVGRWGKNLIREFDSIANIKTACSTGGKKNARWLKQGYPHIAHTTDSRTIFSDPSINAVVIATPIQTHAGLAASALRAGKHVFAEKPLATSTAQAERLYALAKKRGRALFVGNTFLHHPVFQALQKKTRKDPVRHMHASWEKFGTFEEDLLWNITYHDITLAIALFGVPADATLAENASGVTGSDMVSVRLRFKNNRAAHIYTNRVALRSAKTVMFITRTRAFLWEDRVLYRLNPKLRAFTPVYRSPKSPLANVCRAFLKNIKTAPASSDEAALNIAAIRTLTRLRRYSPPK